MKPHATAAETARRAPRVRHAVAAVALAVLPWGAPPAARAATPQSIADAAAAAAPAPPSAARGEAFFRQRHGQPWSCASCHGERPTTAGRHAATGKALAPLAPAFDPQRLTDPAKVDKWFARNCRDVLDRACTAQERADVLAWLLSLK